MRKALNTFHHDPFTDRALTGGYRVQHRALIGPRGVILAEWSEETNSIVNR